MRPDRQVLVITGMHRSGTSLVASMAQRSGVPIGQDLMAPNSGNPRGYFEDNDFVDLHDAMLHRAGSGVFVEDLALLGPPGAEDLETAKGLIAGRRHHDLWGFKDPRTALFLDFWDGLLDDARYLFLYRHPVDVVLSLIRRGADLEILADPATGCAVWTAYNAAILDFYRRHGDRCYLAGINALVHDIDAFAAAFEAKLDLRIDVGACRSLIAPEDLHRTPLTAAHQDVLRCAASAASQTWDDLEREADLPEKPVSTAQADDATRQLALLAGSWAAHEGLRQPATGPLLSLLLASLAPQLAASSKPRLSRLIATQRAQLRELEQELIVRTRWAERLNQEITEKDQRLLELSAEARSP